MHTNTTGTTTAGVDREELDRHIAHVEGDACGPDPAAGTFAQR
jgi:hypothetical protein